MSRKTAIIVLASVAVAIGLGVLFSNIDFHRIDPDSMPVGSLIYLDQDFNEMQKGLNRSGYHWKEKDPSTGIKNWENAGPNNFFTEKFGLVELMPGELEINLQIIWLEPPDNIVIKRWPLSEWTPDDFETRHSEGVDVGRGWETKGNTTNIGFEVERGSLYGIWVYYGDAWVEYSFMVTADDPTEYDYLGYFSGFDNPEAEQFTLDPIEWIGASDTARIKELNLDVEDDFPGGFYIYNPTNEAVSLRLTNQTKYTIIDPETGNTSKTVDRTEFLNYLNQSPNFGETTLFWITETDGNVEFVKEQYVP